MGTKKQFVEPEFTTKHKPAMAIYEDVLNTLPMMKMTDLINEEFTKSHLKPSERKYIQKKYLLLLCPPPYSPAKNCHNMLKIDTTHLKPPNFINAIGTQNIESYNVTCFLTRFTLFFPNVTLNLTF